MTEESGYSTDGIPAAVGFADTLKLMRRHLLFILLVAVIPTVLAAYVLSTISARYTAKALLVIDNRGTDLVNHDSVISRLPTDPETIMSEIQVIKSHHLANLVIDQLTLNEQMEFNDALRPPGFFSRLFGAGAQGEKTSAPVELSTGNELIQGQRVRIIEEFISKLNVEPLPRSRAVSISFTAENPVMAAQVTNTLADLYLQDQLDSKFEVIHLASEWLNNRVASLRESVQESERRVEEFRERSGLLEGGGTTLTDQEISQINAQVITASNQRAEANAKLRQVRRLLASADGVASAGEVLNSELIQRLREQQTAVQGRLAELSSEFGDLHPTMIKLRAEAADLDEKIATEIGKIVSELENRVRIARSREANLVANLDEAKLRVGENNKALVTLRSLEREAAASRQVLEAMLTRFAQTSEQDNLASQRPDARIISRAVVPHKPSYPMKKALLVLVFLGAGFTGLIIAFAREFMDDRLRSGEQLEEVTGLVSLGIIPRLGRRTLDQQTPFTHLLKHPNTPFSESFRTLFSALSTQSGDKSAKKILIASSMANEGKTTVAICLASTIALSGKRVVIVDADCRRPTVTEQMGIENGTGLIHCLTGQASLNDVIHTHKDTGADVIGAGKATHNPPATLASQKFDALLTLLSSRYDYIIIDSPPIMAVSDALMITGKVDTTVMVTHWESTRLSAVRHSIKRLRSAGGNLAGGLLTMVNANKYAHYGYGDSGSYAGELASYQTG